MFASLILTFCTLLSTGAVQAKYICADSSGVFLGLAADEDAYDSIAGSELEPFVDDPDNPGFRRNDWGPPRPSPPQKWTLTQEGGQDGPKNSYAGKYLQVMKDVGRRYPFQYHRLLLESASELENDSPYVSFRLRISKEGAGFHTLFVRWTAGDVLGDGDSFYAIMKTKKGNPVMGQQTLKPSISPIESGVPGLYAGCCRHPDTNECTCFHEKPTEKECSRHRFIGFETAVARGVQCITGAGKMDFVRIPEWYLFAGQENRYVMDFDSEPWDASCEANGSNMIDSGRDYPSWNLGKGEYELRIYAREDGTALDGIYIGGPSGHAPSVTRRYAEGDSTICHRDLTTIGHAIRTLLFLMAVGAFVAFIILTEAGRDFKDRVIMRVNNICNGNLAWGSNAPVGYELQLEFE